MDTADATELDRSESERIVPEGQLWSGAQFIVGRWFPGTDALDRLSFADDLVATAAALRPVADAILAQAKPEPPTLEPPQPDQPVPDNDPIPTLADELLLNRSFLEDIVDLLRDTDLILHLTNAAGRSVGEASVSGERLLWPPSHWHKGEIATVPAEIVISSTAY